MRVPHNIKRIAHQAIAHAKETPAEEVCGLIVSGHLIRGTNIATGMAENRDGTYRKRSLSTDFELDAETFNLWRKAFGEGERPIIYHSHVQTDNKDFSASDVDAMHSTQCPFLLIHTPTEELKYFDITVEQPYENREWHWAYSNCYTLARDWLRKEMGFALYAPTLEKDNAWTDSSWDEMRIHGDRQLIKIPKDRSLLQKGDILIMKMGETVNPNHLAVYIDPIRNEILHHLTNRQSAKQPLSSARWKAVSQIYRVPDHACNI